MTRRTALSRRRRGPLGILLAHHREHEAHHVVMLMIVAAALSLIATILVAGAAGYVAVASHIRHAHTYWFPFAIVGAVAAHVGYTFAYREVAHVGHGVRLGTLRAGAIVLTQRGVVRPVRPDRLLQMGLAFRRWGVSIASAFAVNAIRRADQAAIVDDDGSISYAEADARTNALANELARLGVAQKDHLAMAFPRVGDGKEDDVDMGRVDERGCRRDPVGGRVRV